MLDGDGRLKLIDFGLSVRYGRDPSGGETSFHVSALALSVARSRPSVVAHYQRNLLGAVVDQSVANVQHVLTSKRLPV